LADFLLSDRVQAFLLEFGKQAGGAEPLFFPVAADTAGKDDEELAGFRTFIREHPRALEELKKDPSLVGKPEFASAHEVVGEYLAKHPAIPDMVRKVPHFFDNLTPTRTGGQHRNHPEEKGK
jgi:hypothetical protein